MSAKELQETLISFKESLSNSSEVGRNEEEKRLISPEYRQDALELELQQVQNVNKVIENAITSLDQAGNNVDMVLETAKNTDELLDIWIKILSQSSHISNLLMNTENWFGATKDDELYEDRLREIQRQQEQERLLQEQRAREEEERRQKQEEIERRRKQKEDLLRSRVYGKRAPTSKASKSNSSGTKPTTGRRAAGTSRPTSSHSRFRRT